MPRNKNKIAQQRLSQRRQQITLGDEERSLRQQISDIEKDEASAFPTHFLRTGLTGEPDLADLILKVNEVKSDRELIEESLKKPR